LIQDLQELRRPQEIPQAACSFIGMMSLRLLLLAAAVTMSVPMPQGGIELVTQGRITEEITLMASTQPMCASTASVSFMQKGRKRGRSAAFEEGSDQHDPSLTRQTKMLTNMVDKQPPGLEGQEGQKEGPPGEPMSQNRKAVFNGSVVTGLDNEPVVVSLQSGPRRLSKCKGYKKVPFAITNIPGKNRGPKLEYSYHSTGYSNRLYFLKDVELCEPRWLPWVIKGTRLDHNGFQREVKTYMNRNKLKHVLYYLHGFSTAPKTPFKQIYDYNKKGIALGIPIQWRNKWGQYATGYPHDRDTHAVIMGKQLARNFAAFKADYKQSIMCQSLGNWVFRVFALKVAKPEQVFDHAFMVAADVRSDLFSNDFNKKAPRTKHEEELDEFNALVQQEHDTPDGWAKEEFEPDGGYAITKIAKMTHVVWNKWDSALKIREGTKLPFGPRIKRALGRFGDQGKQWMQLEYFKQRVLFHDFSPIVEHWGVQHVYQWRKESTDLYKKFMAKDLDKQKLGHSR